MCLHLFSRRATFFCQLYRLDEEVVLEEKKLNQISRLRTLLENFQIVVEFAPHTESKEKRHDKDQQLELLGGGDEWDSCFQEEHVFNHPTKPDSQNTERVFAHIGTMNFKTWHFAVLRMEFFDPCAKEPFLLQTCSAAECEERQSVYTDMELFAYVLDLALSWRMRFHFISEREQDWSFLPHGVIPVCNATDFEEVIVWHGSAEEASKRRSAAAAARAKQGRSKQQKRPSRFPTGGHRKKRPRREVSETLALDAFEAEDVLHAADVSLNVLFMYGFYFISCP